MREYKITATVKHMDWDEPVTYIYKMNIEADWYGLLQGMGWMLSSILRALSLRSGYGERAL